MLLHVESKFNLMKFFLKRALINRAGQTDRLTERQKNLRETDRQTDSEKRERERDRLL